LRSTKATKNRNINFQKRAQEPTDAEGAHAESRLSPTPVSFYGDPSQNAFW
jgi:hypothetical protein